MEAMPAGVSLPRAYGVPLLLTTDRFSALTSDDQVLAVAPQQVDAIRAADCHHSEVLDSELTVLNSTSAPYRGSFSRQRRDGSEISRLTVTYIVTGAPASSRVSVLAVHSP